jgi:hypothetical protein
MGAVADPAGAAVAGVRTGRLSFADLSVNVKVLAAVTTAALAALVVGILGLTSLAGASPSAERIYRSNVASIKAVGQLKAVVLQALAVGRRDVPRSPSPEPRGRRYAAPPHWSSPPVNEYSQAA